MYFALTASSFQGEENSTPGSKDKVVSPAVSSGPVGADRGTESATVVKEKIRERVNSDCDSELDYPQLHEEKVWHFGLTYRVCLSEGE